MDPSKRLRLIPDLKNSPCRVFMARADPNTIDRIFHLLPWPDLTALSSTSSNLRRIVVSYRDRTWNINNFLKPLLHRPLVFRGVLAFAGALVTGTQVVRFFDRLPPAISSELDVVTRVGGVMPLVLFLEQEGYIISPDGPSTAKNSTSTMNRVFQLTSSSAFEEKGGATGIVGVLNFWRPTNEGSEGHTKIRLVVVTQRPVEHIIMSYHSTGIMNFVSHKEAVSIFPVSTFLHRVVYPSSREDLGPLWNPKWVHDVRKQGFRVDVSRTSPPFHIGLRTALDSYSWVIPLGDSDTPLIQSQVGHAVYGDEDIDSFEFDIVWMSELAYGIAQWRVSMYEPKVFWYLVPTYIVD